MGDDRGTLAIKTVNGSPLEHRWDCLNVQDDLVEPSETPPIVIEEVSAVKTRLFLGNVSRAHDYVCLSVEDSGTGMTAVIMENIFEPFFTTKDVDKGTGLGLATVLGVISGHRGALVLESELGVGTAFHLYFPVMEGEESVAEQDVQMDDNILAARILLVEDQENVRAVTERALIRQGYDVDSCENGLEALAVLRDCPEDYDLVITDHNMPKMSGIELINSIYLDQPDIPFIVLSGYSEEKLQDLMADHEAVKAVLRKPISKDILHKTIQSILPQIKQAA